MYGANISCITYYFCVPWSNVVKPWSAHWKLRAFIKTIPTAAKLVGHTLESSFFAFIWENMKNVIRDIFLQGALQVLMYSDVSYFTSVGYTRTA